LFDKFIIGRYNVITMITTLIAIGNSRGGLSNQVELQVKKGEIRIIAASVNSRAIAAPLLLSERILATDWNRPEEDEAWASLQ